MASDYHSRRGGIGSTASSCTFPVASQRKEKAQGRRIRRYDEDDLRFSSLSNENDDFPVRPGESVAGGAGMDDFDDGFADEEANFNMSMRRGMKLKENVNEFVERNPQIAAKLLQSWLKENDE